MFLSFYYGKTIIFGCFFSSELNIKPTHTSTETLRRLDSAFGVVKPKEAARPNLKGQRDQRHFN